MDVVGRPQPVGVFSLPAGYLLIADGGPDVSRARASLVAGRVPAEWPPSLRGVELAHAGDVAGALEAFSGDGVVDRFNRFVLAPEGVDVAALRAALPAPIAPMVDVVAYAVGLTDQVPALGAADGEIAAVVLGARASADLADGAVPAAVDGLRAAADAVGNPDTPLAALLLGNAGALAAEHGLDGDQALTDLTHAVGVLTPTDLTGPRAELHYQLASALHAAAARGTRPLTAAVHHYYTVLQLIDRESAPALWAAAQADLGTAYLTMPMVEASDQLRTGIAMQCLRAALEVFTREEYPAEWSAAQLNLANALVYAPSAHQADNLVEAVERYEEVLELRTREDDPLGRARLLANQGNALAHLGVFDHAKAKLYEARYLFEESGDHQAVMTVRSVLDEIAKRVVPTPERVSAP
ncbi:hypothetical protein [Cryptosporangium sp. NPDC051539]|uniref:hypothetical protein n=1 Tax=Cryptosporangium sp. NPDC051539 TaxID=3363962 RepID=UPI00379F1599